MYKEGQQPVALIDYASIGTVHGDSLRARDPDMVAGVLAELGKRGMHRILMANGKGVARPEGFDEIIHVPEEQGRFKLPDGVFEPDTSGPNILMIVKREIERVGDESVRIAVSNPTIEWEGVGEFAGGLNWKEKGLTIYDRFLRLYQRLPDDVDGGRLFTKDPIYGARVRLGVNDEGRLPTVDRIRIPSNSY